MIHRVLAILSAILVVAACSSQSSPVSPTGAPVVGNSSALAAGGHAEQPPFNLEARLIGDGFGLVTFRQQKDPTANVIALGVWVRDLVPDTSYSLQRAVDTVTWRLAPASYPALWGASTPCVGAWSGTRSSR